MKRIFTLLLVLCLVSLAGCGQNTAAALAELGYTEFCAFGGIGTGPMRPSREQ